jgi:two-component system chemotaxis sensor kinase CheA
MAVDEATRQMLRDEVHENLAELEAAILEMEAGCPDGDCVDRIFRALHTVKGVGAMFGHEGIAGFAHSVESIYAQVREGVVPVTPRLMNLTLAARDHLLALFDEPDDALPEDGEDIVRDMEECAGVPAAVVDGAASAALPDIPVDVLDVPTGAGAMASYRIRFAPLASVFASLDLAGLFGELEELGEYEAVAHMGDVPPLSELDPEVCHVRWDIFLTTDRGEDAIHDVFIFVEGDGVVDVEVLERENDDGDDDTPPRLGDILVRRGELAPHDLEVALGEHQRLGELLTQSGRVAPEDVRSALAEQSAVRKVKSRRRKVQAESSIRVPADKLDDLVSLVGELAIVQAQIAQAATDGSRHHLARLSEELERLSSRLRERTMSVRMLPIGQMFSRFRRLVHDVAAEQGKKVELETFGAETEVDKTVFERIADPLVHLIRNCVGHGIESPEEREAAGKPPVGIIRLGAAHTGGEVSITVEDDGRGMAPEKILERARRLGVVGPEAEVKASEVLQLIFEAGFSTTEEVTSLSGRGVGMDVVRRGIDSLRGRVDVESTPGQGTSFALRIPLTLAIIEGLQVRVSGEFYVIPLAAVQECLEFHPEEANVLDIRGEIIPWVRLRELFGLNGDKPDVEQIVVAGSENRRIGLVVDRVVGEHQTVIRSLGKVYRNVRAFSGATVRADGSMALILDVQGIVQTMREIDAGLVL